MSTEKSKAASSSARRWRWLGGCSAWLLLAGAVYGAYWAQVLRYQQSTDDAYVGGNVVQITPQISGTVVAIGADDTQFVKAGQPLVRLDQADARVALDQAEAQLARTVRDVRNLFATSVAARRPPCSARRPISPRRRATSRAASGSASPARSPARSCSTPPMRVQDRAGGAPRGPAAARRQPRARRRHDARGSPAGARCRRRGAQRLPDARAHRAAGAGRRVRRAAQRAARRSASAPARR